MADIFVNEFEHWKLLHVQENLKNSWSDHSQLINDVVEELFRHELPALTILQASDYVPHWLTIVAIEGKIGDNLIWNFADLFNLALWLFPLKSLIIFATVLFFYELSFLNFWNCIEREAGLLMDLFTCCSTRCYHSAHWHNFIIILIRWSEHIKGLNDFFTQRGP